VIIGIQHHAYPLVRCQYPEKYRIFFTYSTAKNAYAKAIGERLKYCGDFFYVIPYCDPIIVMIGKWHKRISFFPRWCKCIALIKCSSCKYKYYAEFNFFHVCPGSLGGGSFGLLPSPASSGVTTGGFVGFGFLGFAIEFKFYEFMVCCIEQYTHV
jgi:hypothetical protein